MYAIFAVDNNYGLGNSQVPYGIPWKCKNDMRHFKKTVARFDKVLVGYKTAQLMGADNYIVDHEEYEPSGDELVIGGKNTLMKYWDQIDFIYMGNINGEFDCDCYFPELEHLMEDFEIVGIKVDKKSKFDTADGSTMAMYRRK